MIDELNYRSQSIDMTMDIAKTKIISDSESFIASEKLHLFRSENQDVRKFSEEWLIRGQPSEKSNRSLSQKHLTPKKQILPILTYGEETWCVTKTLARNSLEHRDPKKGWCWGDELKSRKGLEIKSLKWNWAGHAARRSDNRWSKRTFEWIRRKEKWHEEGAWNENKSMSTTGWPKLGVVRKMIRRRPSSRLK